MKKNVCLASILTLILVICLSVSVTAAPPQADTSKFSPADVVKALDQKTSGTVDPNVAAIADNVILPGSMDIKVPNINMEKVIITTPLSAYEYDFAKELQEHGVTATPDMTYDQYREIEKTWKLNEEQIKMAKRAYPELEKQDISNWTNGDYKSYYAKVDKANLEKGFKPEQLQELTKRGIRKDDLVYLLKEFYTPDAIVAQPDEVLKNTIQGYYQFRVDQVEQMAVRSIPGYTSQDMPRYGVDDFLNAVVTSEYWLQVQSDRTLVAMRALFDINFSTFTRTDIQNMYGTYSLSQEGAHEGIDFSYGDEWDLLYSPVDGVVITDDGLLYHQLAIYDSGAGKTYNFLHMVSKAVSPGTPVDPRVTFIGYEGHEGNATGDHVHFEVHSGETVGLSEEDNDILGSISPYQLQIYLGEL